MINKKGKTAFGRLLKIIDDLRE
ncbi:uncharacterized protein METZ01_LOCUS505727, partial [marine metagenome]